LILDGPHDPFSVRTVARNTGSILTVLKGYQHWLTSLVETKRDAVAVRPARAASLEGERRDSPKTVAEGPETIRRPGLTPRELLEPGEDR
jgi:hypothetical protein